MAGLGDLPVEIEVDENDTRTDEQIIMQYKEEEFEKYIQAVKRESERQKYLDENFEEIEKWNDAPSNSQRSKRPRRTFVEPGPARYVVKRTRPLGDDGSQTDLFGSYDASQRRQNSQMDLFSGYDPSQRHQNSQMDLFPGHDPSQRRQNSQLDYAGSPTQPMDPEPNSSNGSPDSFTITPSQLFKNYTTPPRSKKSGWKVI